MNIRMRQLKALLAIVDTGSVTAAANELSLTQSTVSKLLSALEIELEFSLFDRIGKTLQLTEKGRLFLKQARLSLEAFEDVTKSAKDIRENHGKRLRISTVGPLSYAPIVPAALARFSRWNPEFALTLDNKVRIEIEEWIAQGHADLGFTLLPASHPAIEARELVSVQAMAVVPVDHPLASRSRLQPEDVVGETIVMPHSKARVRTLVEANFVSAGLTLSPNIETSNAVSAVSLVSQGAGLSVLDPFSALSMSADHVRLVPWEPETSMTYGMIFQSHRALSALEEQIFEFVVEQVEDYLQPLHV